MNEIERLINEVAVARNQYLAQLTGVSEAQAQWKQSAEEWNLVDITEHLFWAEQGALFGMWKTIKAIRDGITIPQYDSVHKNLPIEKIIALTWQQKEQVPAMAAPRLGGSLSFWFASLNSLQQVLSAFGDDLKENELRLLAHPHPISGAMDFQQRLEFLRFHLNRHMEQAARLIHEMQQTAI